MKTIVLTILCFVASFAPAYGQSKIVPIIEINSQALLGGFEDGKWLDAKTTVARLGNENLYKTYRLSPVSNGEAKYPKPKDEGVPCEGFYSIEGEMADKFGVAIGANAAWNPVPRAPKTIDLNDAVYKKAATDVLRTKGVVSRNLKLKQAFRVDLEGDGREEVLIEATSYSGATAASAKRGDYSFILLRKIVGGKVQNIIVTGEFIRKNIPFGAPGTYRLSAVADLNGDGVMEIIVFASYYEGIWVETYEMKGIKPRVLKVLGVGCGV